MRPHCYGNDENYGTTSGIIHSKVADLIRIEEFFIGVQQLLWSPLPLWYNPCESLVLYQIAAIYLFTSMFLDPGSFELHYAVNVPSFSINCQTISLEIILW